MDIILALITSVIIYLTFRVLEVKFPQFNFTILELIHGKFSWKSITLSIVIPFVITLLFGLIYETTIPAAYSIPGFLAALLIVWPFFRNPENIPEEMRIAKERAYVVYLFFIASFTLVSYLGGFTGSRGLPNFLPSPQGIVDGFWIVLFGALVAHFGHRFLNKKFPQQQNIKKAEINLPRDDGKPLQT